MSEIEPPKPVFWAVVHEDHDHVLLGSIAGDEETAWEYACSDSRGLDAANQEELEAEGYCCIPIHLITIMGEGLNGSEHGP